ncbi:MAG: serine protease [Proteobacteria bacterium]|nr:serine protease [Pseudomonadota bacterium]MBU1390054.1 serine protease [Pseudomonadota bacterium]MBU1544995.1 serine protease [Pseudomonadota bacterium]MBU2429144.1 serine protease [Pseudomonadota bacterium]MBU2480977.1 serine protease [Pseudomonadota bacterium]
MKSYLLPVFLQLIGFAVIVAEIFIPSFGILGLIAASVFAYSLYVVYTSISVTAGMVFTVLDIFLVPVFIILGIKALARSPLSLQRKLLKKDGVESQDETHRKLVNAKGIAITDLRPSGIAEIDDKRFDVVTDGEYIEADTPVVVTQVAGNRVVVGEIK